jgi:hypothetical protein
MVDRSQAGRLLGLPVLLEVVVGIGGRPVQIDRPLRAGGAADRGCLVLLGRRLLAARRP